MREIKAQAPEVKARGIKDKLQVQKAGIFQAQRAQEVTKEAVKEGVGVLFRRAESQMGVGLIASKAEGVTLAAMDVVARNGKNVQRPRQWSTS